MRLLKYAIIVAAIAITGCSKKNSKEDGGGSPSAQPGGQNPIGPAGPAPSVSPTTPPPTAGSLAIDMKDATALGVAVVGAGSGVEISAPVAAGSIAAAALTAEPRNLLTKRKADGSLVAFNLPDAPGGGYFEVVDITNVGDYGAIVRMSNGGYFSEHPEAAMAWIQPDGSIVPFAPEGYKDGVGDFFLSLTHQMAGTKFWMHNVNQNALWSFDFAEPSFAQFTDDMQQMMGFLVTGDGHVLAQMSLLGTSNASPPIVLRQVKPDGGFNQFVTANGNEQIDDSMVFHNKAIIYGQPVKVDGSGNLEFTFLPERLMAKVSGRTDSAVVVGEKWVVSHQGAKRFAFNLNADAAAGNPLKSAPPLGPGGATEPTTNLTNVHSAAGIHYDGANLVTINRTAGTTSSALFKRFIYPRGRALRVMRVFGEDHGFTGASYFGFGNDRANKVWWVEIDKASGVVKANDAKEVTNIAAIDSVATSSQFFQNTSVYSVGSNLVVFNMGANGKSLSWLIDDGNGGQTFQIKKTNTDFDAFNSPAGKSALTHGYSAVQSGKLYFAGSNKVFVYDPSNNSISQIADSTLFGAQQLDEDCQTPRHVAAIVTRPSTATPAVVVRLCKGNDTANGKLAFIELSDWTFAAVRGGTSAIDLGETVTETETERRFPEPSWSAGGELIFVKRWKNELLTSTNGTTFNPANVNTLVTPEIYEFGASINPGNGIDLVAAWSDSAFVAHGKNSSQDYVSYYVNPEARTETPVGSLSGVQVYSAARLEDAMLINGLRLSDNVKVNVTFNMAGSVVSLDERSNIKIVKIVPFKAKK